MDRRELGDIDLDRPWTRGFSSVVTKLDVYYFFRHILGRHPAESEWRGHCQLVGRDLTDSLGAYLNSPEFKRRGLAGFVPKGVARIRLEGGYVIYAAENDLIGGAILARGIYEPEVTAVFHSLLRPGMTVLDIGANIGWFTLLSAALVGRTGKVFSFEPSQLNARFLALNKAANSFDQVELVLAAASDRMETLAYSSSLSNGFVTDLGCAQLEAILDSNVVFAVPPDLVVPPALPVHLIKVDVEGWEMKALRGARRIIERWRPRIVCEFSPPALQGASGVSGEAFLAHFKDLGYRFEVIRDGGNLDCGVDLEEVMSAYRDLKSSHIDILMTHFGTA